MIEGPAVTSSPRRQIPVIKPKKMHRGQGLSSGNTSHNVIDMQVTSYGLTSSAINSGFNGSSGIRSNGHLTSKEAAQALLVAN